MAQSAVDPKGRAKKPATSARDATADGFRVKRDFLYLAVCCQSVPILARVLTIV